MTVLKFKRKIYIYMQYFGGCSTNCLVI